MIRMIPRYRLKVWADLETTATGAVAGQWAFELAPIDGVEEPLLADGSESNITSDRLELLAFVRGLEALDDPAWVYLNTDSRYVRHGLKYGLARWKDNNWRWEDSGVWLPVKHADLWRRVDRAMDIHRLAWQRGTAIGGGTSSEAGIASYERRTSDLRNAHLSAGPRPMRTWLDDHSEQRRQNKVLVA
jgi:ribonuclease HI